MQTVVAIIDVMFNSLTAVLITSYGDQNHRAAVMFNSQEAFLRA